MTRGDSLTSTRPARVLPAVCVLLLGAFVVCLALAVRAYPGGSWRDAQAPGFSFGSNYWCDLLSPQAWNGAPNHVSAGLASAAFLALAASLACFWRLASRLVADPRTARRARRLGLASSLAVVVMVAAPYPAFRVTHAASTLTAGGCGAVATLLVVMAAARGGVGARVRFALGAVFLATALANVAVYTRLVIQGGGTSAVLPVVQKLATLALLPWMLATLAGARRARGAGAAGAA